MRKRPLKALSLVVFIGMLINSCSSSSNQPWEKVVPKQTSFIITPSSNATVQSVLHAKFIPFLENISASDLQLVSKIDSNASRSLPVHSILLYPGTHAKFQLLWITRAPDHFQDKLIHKYGRKFAQNKYYFHGLTILNLKLNQRHIFVARLSKLLLISESSLGIENAIRTYKGLQAGAELSDIKEMPASLIINTPSLDLWISRLARVRYDPKIHNFLKGTRPARVTITHRGDSTKHQYKLQGVIPLSGDEHRPLINSLSSQNGLVTLDKYVPSDAAGLGIFHAPPPSNPANSIPDTTQADAYLLHHNKVYKSLSKTLGDEFAMVMFAQSGFASRGEYLFLRKLKDSNAFREKLKSMSANNLAKDLGGVYFVQSNLFGNLLGSRLCNFKNFYITFTGDVAVIAKRKGLAQRLVSDRKQRQVITFEPFYRHIKKQLKSQLSGLFIFGPDFNSFLKPLLSANSYVAQATAAFKYISLSTRINKKENKLSLSLSTYNQTKNNKSYRNRWIFNTQGAELTGRPVFGNIGGGFNDEVVFATDKNKVYALAADGTLLQEFDTGSDTPIGSPVVYDWYGTGQKVILIAAGNKIYGWDEHGDLLPRFPFRLKETITTTLSIADINHNKLPNAIVATANRKVHVLNGRGKDLKGWPVTTNDAVTSAPLIKYYHGKSSVIAFASNAVHGWDASGHTLPGYPHFINAEFRGSPATYENTILGGAVDGNLYAMGDQIAFSESPDSNQSNNASGKDFKAVNLSNSALAGTPVVYKNKILIAASNGSIFVVNTNGALQFTKNIGQSAKGAGEETLITDLNADGKQDIVALAGYGRLYGWELKSGRKIKSLPSAAMHHLNIGDLDGDGLKEVVAETAEGLQCWTINRGH